MRISADPKSPWFSTRALCASVFLDGEQVMHCVTADEEEGTAECFKRDATGCIVHDGEFAAMETLRGQVDIIYPGMNFDAWMRARTDRAHAAYMAGHAAGGIAYT